MKPHPQEASPVSDHMTPPLNPLPWIVWALALPLIAVEALIGLGQTGLVGGAEAIGWRLDAVERFGFSPALQKTLIAQGQWVHDGWLRLLTYPLAHLSFMDALFGIVILLAIGNLLGRLYSPLALAGLFVGSSVLAALIYTGLGFAAPLVGADPAVYGLIGGYTFVQWARFPAGHPDRSRAFTLAGFLIGLRVFFWAVFGGSMSWIAAVIAVPIGFALGSVLVPGGWSRLMARLRQR